MQILGRIRMPNLAGAPAGPASGEMYFDTGTSTLYWWSGTAWVPAMDTGGGGGAGVTEVNVSTAGPSPRVGELLWVDTDDAPVASVVGYGEDLTARATASAPAVLGVKVAATVTAGVSGLVNVMATWEFSAATNMNVWTQILCDGISLGADVNDNTRGLRPEYTDYQQWLSASGRGSAVWSPGGTWLPLAYFSHATRYPFARVPFVDSPGPGAHEYEMRTGGTGGTVSVRNRRLWAWPI
jgi:hypothetical protein